jgi:cobalt-zinc-cadmium efflux system membrane fusion protein
MKIKNIFFLMVLLMVVACNSKKIPVEVHSTKAIDEIVITRSQFKQAEMKLKTPEIALFRNTINCAGQINVAAGGKVQVTSNIAGIIRSAPMPIGAVVKRGSTLFSIESVDAIALQQDYAETFATLTYAKQQLNRVRLLAEDQIAAQKELQQAESEYKSLLAKVEGLKARLSLIGIDNQQVENGKIVSAVIVTSPINGVVTKQETTKGQYVEPSEFQMELIDLDALQLKINLFSKDMWHLQIGQKIEFYSDDNPSEVHSAILKTIGKSIDENTKTIVCFADIEPRSKSKLVEGMYVESAVVVSERAALALPQTAVFKLESDYYVLVQTGETSNEITFKKQKIEVGATTDSLIEIKTDNLPLVLIDGGFNLISE